MKDREERLCILGGTATPEHRQRVEALLDDFKAAVLRALREGQEVSLELIVKTAHLHWVEAGRIVGPGTAYESGQRDLRVSIGRHPQAKDCARAEYEAAKC